MKKEPIKSISEALEVIKKLQVICRTQRQELEVVKKENMLLKAAAGYSGSQADNISSIFGKAFGNK